MGVRTVGSWSQRGAPRGCWLAYLGVWLLQHTAIVFTGAAADAPPPLFVRGLDFSRDGTLLAAAATSDDKLRGELVVWEIESMSPRFVRTESVGFPRVAFSPDGSMLALARFAPECLLIKTSSGEVVRELRGNETHVRCLAFTRDGQRLVTGGTDRTLKIWNLDTGAADTTLAASVDAVYHLAVSPDGLLLATADGQSSTARLWDLASGQQLHSFQNLGSLVPHVCFSPDGRWLAASSWLGRLHVFDTQTHEAYFRLRDMGGVDGAAFSADGCWLAVVTNGPDVFVFDVNTRADDATRVRVDGLLARFLGDDYHDREAAMRELAEIGMAAEPQLRSALVAESPEVRWRARKLRSRLCSGTSARRLTFGPERLGCVAFSGDSSLLAAGNDRGDVRLWRVSDWQELTTLSIEKAAKAEATRGR